MQYEVVVLFECTHFLDVLKQHNPKKINQNKKNLAKNALNAFLWNATKRTYLLYEKRIHFSLMKDVKHKFFFWTTCLFFVKHELKGVLKCIG